MVGTALDPDVEAEIEISHEVELSSSFKVGLGVQPTQPPDSLLEMGITTSDVSGLTGVFGFISTSGSMDVPESISGFHSRVTRDDVT